MKAEPVATTPIKGSAPVGADLARRPAQGESRARGAGAEIDWLKGAIDKIIEQQRPRVPGWGFLKPHQIVGEYDADKDYLLVVFDHRGQPHTRRFSEQEIRQLGSNRDKAATQFRNLIESFCADA